jgi:hypothetical protein
MRAVKSYDYLMLLALVSSALENCSKTPDLVVSSRTTNCQNANIKHRF